jgi:hypothetical protein
LEGRLAPARQEIWYEFVARRWLEHHMDTSVLILELFVEIILKDPERLIGQAPLGAAVNEEKALLMFMIHPPLLSSRSSNAGWGSVPLPVLRRRSMLSRGCG